MPRSCKATLDILLRHRGEIGLAEGTEELELAHVVNIYPYQVLDLATVRLFQRPKIADIEWLAEVRGMRRYIERDNIVLLAVELEFGRVVALVAIEDQQLVFALCLRCYI